MENWDNIELVASAAITTLGSVLVALIGWFKFFGERGSKEEERDAKEHAQQELVFQSLALGFNEFVEEWVEITAQLDRLMTDTKIDRFLILRAWNGSRSPLWTTAFYQYRLGDQRPVPYIHFKLDSDYQDRLRQIIGSRFMYFKVADIDGSFVKQIYSTEGVTAAFWAHLSSFSISQAGSNSKAIIYCSFATHEPEGLDEDCRLQAMLLVNRLEGVIRKYHDSIPMIKEGDIDHV